MNLSIFLARFFGLYFLIGGFFYLFRKETFQEAVQDFYTNKGLMVTSGSLNLIIGLLLILTHSIWVWDWPVIITLIGYLSLIKGIVRLFFSDYKFAMKMTRGHNPVYLGILCLIIGLLLVYEGFIA